MISLRRYQEAARDQALESFRYLAGQLRVLEKTNDGFEIAEADLRLRGAGDLLGTAQSGLPPLKLGELFRDADLMKLRRSGFMILWL